MHSVVAVIAGYLLFAASAVALFQLSGVDPHGPSAIGFRTVATLYGLVFALGAGYLASRVAPLRRARVSIGVAVLIALAAVISLLASPGEHAIWTQVESLLIFAPAAIMGGRLAGGVRPTARRAG